jgi:hypothetical protein
MVKIAATARKLKVTSVRDPASFVNMPRPPDNAPGRTELAVTVDGRTYRDDVATRSPSFSDRYVGTARGTCTNEINGLGSAEVTGAKSWAEVGILLAPTRVGSIQPGCDRPD